MKRISCAFITLFCVATSASASTALRSAKITCGYISTYDELKVVGNNLLGPVRSDNYPWQACPVGLASTTLSLSSAATQLPTAVQYGLKIGSCSSKPNIIKLVVTPAQTSEQSIKVTSDLGYKDGVAIWNAKNNKPSYEGFSTPAETTQKTSTIIKGNLPYTILWVEGCGAHKTFNFKAE